MSRHSLQELVAWCKHELIGPYVQEIIFYPCGLSNKYLDIVLDQTDSSDTDGDFEGVINVERLVEWYFTAPEDEKSLEESGDATMLFEQAFSALRVYRKPIKLTVKTQESSQLEFTRSEGGNERPGLEEFPSFWQAAYVQGADIMSVFTILKATIAAGGQINTLELRTGTQQRFPMLHKDVRLSYESVQALASLERLEVHLGGPSPAETIDKILVAIVYSARRLVRVILSSNPVYTGTSYGLAWHMFRLVEVLKSHALRQIWLRDIAIHLKDFLNMLRKHKNTLKELTISNVLLLGRSWNEVLSTIRDDLRLDTLVMIDLSTAQDHKYRGHQSSYDSIKYPLRGGVELSGNGVVPSGVDEVLNKWKKQKVDPYYDPGWRSAADMGHLAYPED